MSLGSGFDFPVELVPESALGSGFDVGADFTPGRTLGSGFDGPALYLSGLGYRPLRRDSTGVRELREELDQAVLGAVARGTAGQAKLWADDFTSQITIGGGALNTLVAIGTAGAGVQIEGGPVFDEESILSDLDLTVQATVDLFLRSGGQTLPLNDAVDSSLSSDFSAASLIGALNELETLPRPTVGVLYGNGEAGTLLAGSAVRLSGTVDDEVVYANATADDGASRLIGAVERNTLTGEQARVISDGPVRVLFGAGEGTGDLSQSKVYLSTTNGLFTLVPPATPGNVLIDAGVVISSSGYDNGLGGTMLVLLRRGNRRVVS